MPESSFKIEYSREAIDHLRYLSAAWRAVIFDAVDAQLTSEPLVETRNRKLMRPNQLAVWELRVGDLRVYYDLTLRRNGIPMPFLKADMGMSALRVA